MNLFTNAKVSPAGKINKEDLNKVVGNAVVFLAPLVLLYISQLNAGIQDGILSLGDFKPTLITIGGMQLYLLNALTDLLRKFTDGSK